MNNLRSFREAPTWPDRLWPLLAYLLLGWVVVRSPAEGMGNLLSILMLIGILMWAFILRRRSVKYFIRYHLTQAMLLNVTIGALIWLLVAFFSLLSTVPILNLGVGAVYAILFRPSHLGDFLHGSLMDLLVMAIACVMAFYVLRGHYTRLPWITDTTQQWL